MSELPKDTCLQCGESREVVKANGYYCATLSGYETPEVDAEWERHHWRDWSNAELERMGVHPNFWDQNRRTILANMEFVIGASICLRKGSHLIDVTHMVPGEKVCVGCWNEISPEESAKARRIENYG